MKKKDIKVLEEIQKKTAALYGDRLYKMQPKGDVMLEVAKKALTVDRDKFSEADLDKLQAIIDSKILEGEEKVVDMEVAREMDEFMGAEITKAIKEGRLSHPDRDPFIKKLKQKQRKHGSSNK